MEKKRKPGRPRKEKRYMEETRSWGVRLDKKLFKEFQDTIKRLSRQRGKRIFANSVLNNLIESYVEKNKEQVSGEQ